MSNGVSDAIGAVVGGALEAVTGLPEPVREGFGQAFKRLAVAAVEVPAAWLEGKAAEVRAGSDARVQAIGTAGKQIADQLHVPEQYVAAAQDKALLRIVGKQKNIDAVLSIAKDDLLRLPVQTADPAASPPPQGDGNGPLNEDWLNAFEEEAAKMSTAEMQMLFGKILAGEIRKPGSFSRKTIRVMSQLDNRAAQLFLKLCSISVGMVSPLGMFDLRVPSLGHNAADNGLSAYGLGYTNLTVLFEYGLITAELNSWISYLPTVANNGKVSAALLYGGKQYGLVSKNSNARHELLNIHGVALTLAGRELFAVVEQEKNETYESDLVRYFHGIGYEFSLIDPPIPLNR